MGAVGSGGFSEDVICIADEKGLVGYIILNGCSLGILCYEYEPENAGIISIEALSLS